MLHKVHRKLRRIHGLVFRKLVNVDPRSPGHVFIEKGLRLEGSPVIRACRDSKISIGQSAILLSKQTSNAVGLSCPVIIRTIQRDAVIEIGDDVGISGSAIVARMKITIGNRVLIGGNCKIFDNDFHPLDAEIRFDMNEFAILRAPVVIEDDVWLGHGVTVLKGVTIGCKSVIGAGSVVTKSIPPGVVAAGNPARVIRKI